MSLTFIQIEKSLPIVIIKMGKYYNKYVGILNLLIFY